MKKVANQIKTFYFEVEVLVLDLVAAASTLEDTTEAVLADYLRLIRIPGFGGQCRQCEKAPVYSLQSSDIENVMTRIASWNRLFFCSLLFGFVWFSLSSFDESLQRFHDDERNRTRLDDTRDQTKLRTRYFSAQAACAFPLFGIDAYGPSIAPLHTKQLNESECAYFSWH